MVRKRLVQRSDEKIKNLKRNKMNTKMIVKNTNNNYILINVKVKNIAYTIIYLNLSSLYAFLYSFDVVLNKCSSS